MKNDKKMFILIEAVLAVLVIVLAFIMILGKDEKVPQKISVILQNSDDNQWTAFKYGLKMAAEDQKMELFVVGMESTLTVKEQKDILKSELENGAAGIIVQPVPGTDVGKMLKSIQKKVPVMLIGNTVSEESHVTSVPMVKTDDYSMGKALAEELLKDYNEKIDGKTIGIFSMTGESESVTNREKGFLEAIEDKKAEIRWSFSAPLAEEGKASLESREEVDFVIALDDNSLTTAGEGSAANNLHGALVYGIGNSTEAVYYLDTGAAECLVVPDEFNVGYQSLTETAKSIGSSTYKMKAFTVSYTVITRDNLFSKENQDILFTMSQ